MNASPSPRRLLFVCLGNICRSPAAEGVMRALVERAGKAGEFVIDSAGTGGYHIGDLPDPRMRAAGAKRGYDFSSRARQLCVDDFDDFDGIYVMDDSNRAAALRLARTVEDECKVHRLADFQRRASGYDHVPDPYYGGRSGFDLVLDLLEDACEGLLESLQKQEAFPKRTELK